VRDVLRYFSFHIGAKFSVKFNINFLNVLFIYISALNNCRFLRDLPKNVEQAGTMIVNDILQAVLL